MALAATRKLTLEEYAALPDDGTRRELDEGELVMMTFPKSRHSFAASNLYDSLNPWVRAHHLGRCFMEAGFLLQRQPPILRGPDVAFVRAERIDSVDPDRWFEGSPDLAAEVISPSDRSSDVERKIKQYLRHGSHVVLAIHPADQILRVHRTGLPVGILGPGQALKIPDLFPGWSIPTADLF